MVPPPQVEMGHAAPTQECIPGDKVYPSSFCRVGRGSSLDHRVESRDSQTSSRVLGASRPRVARSMGAGIQSSWSDPHHSPAQPFTPEAPGQALRVFCAQSFLCKTANDTCMAQSSQGPCNQPIWGNAQCHHSQLCVPGHACCHLYLSTSGN